MIAITKHADKRIKERVPGMKSAEKRMAFAECAWRLGVHRGEAGAAADAYLGRREEEAEAFADEAYCRRLERERAKQRRVENKRAAEARSGLATNLA